MIRDPLRGRTRPEAASHTDEEIIARLLAVGPERTVALAGAGMSTDSGIPDYRGPLASPRSPMTYQAFLAGPLQRSRYWARSWVGWDRIEWARPNTGHRALAGLGLRGLITQNVDGLDRMAGTAGVLELHGRLDRVVCLSCGERYSRQWMQDELTALNPGFLDRIEVDPREIEVAPDGDAELEQTRGFRVADCPRCGGLLKPDLVFFGESVGKDLVAEASALVAGAEALVVLGSSLAVLSGLRFVRQAAKQDALVVIDTDGPTRGDELADMRSLSRTSDFLAAWLEAAGRSRLAHARDAGLDYDAPRT
ncbi:Sir2 family NAD-dependent protein deacetylase [Brevibacterium album]|uniref:Sir2 family NAD-dependent protein deacetylase n=1 Tax=Brevibacterium album TaxID=417948 RepID=UPI000418D13B|nr:Sir2 family NAD-dependent protein deacetylase [Brevibacterium album]